MKSEFTFEQTIFILFAIQIAFTIHIPVKLLKLFEWTQMVDSGPGAGLVLVHCVNYDAGV